MNKKLKNIIDNSYNKIKVISIIFLILITLSTLRIFENNKKTVEAKKIDFKTENFVTDISEEVGVPGISEDGINDDVGAWDVFKTGVSFIIAIIWWIIKALLFLVISTVLNVIGTILAAGGGSVQILNIEAVLFNEIPLLNPALWDSPYKSLTGFYSSSAGILRDVFTIALLIQIFVFIVVIIMSIYRTVQLKTYGGSGKKDVANNFKNWAIGVLIIFGIVFYAAIVIGLNNKIVSILRTTINEANNGDITEVIAKDIFSINIMKSTVAFFIYIMIKIQAIALFIKYLNRFIKLMFLILISPIIASTYAVDRIGDGESQALNSWNKMFVQTVLMQIIHVIIYTTTISVLINPGNDTFSLAGLFISVLGVNFIWTAEKVIYDMFGMDKGEMGSLLGSAALVQSIAMKDEVKSAVNVTVGYSKKIGVKLGSGVKKGKAKFKKTKFGQKADGFFINVNVNLDKFKNKAENTSFGRAFKKTRVTGKRTIHNLRVKKEKTIESIKLAPTKLAQGIKRKAYNIAGLKAPEKQYSKELKRKKRNIRRKKIDKYKKKKEKKATRKKRIISKAVTFAASAGSLAVAASTRQLEISDFGQSYLRGRIVKDAVMSNMSDKSVKPKKKEKDKNSLKDISMQKEYEDMFNEYKRSGEEVLDEKYENSKKYDLKEKEAIKNMLIAAKMKESLSGKSFDTNTDEGKNNLKDYTEAMSTLSSRETAHVLNQKVENNKKILKDYLKKDLNKSEQEIKLVLSQIEELVKNGVSIKTNKNNTYMNNYISSLVDKRFFIDKEVYEVQTEKLGYNFKENITENYLANKVKFIEAEKEAEQDLKEESFNIDEYYDL